MKPLRLNVILLVLWVAVVLSGCQHKKQVLIVPQQPPPTAAPTPSPTPEPAASQPAEPADKTQQAEPSTEPAKPQSQQKEAPKHARKPSPRKPANGEKSTTEVARNNPGKKIIPPEKAEPTPPSGQISPGPTPADTRHDQATTDQLLRTAESNLNGIKRPLNKDEETMLAQIREFISQSRKATTENDPERAHNLAVKARVLSDELVKQR
jgi:hypothetical protein